MNCYLKISVYLSTKQSPLNFTMQTLYCHNWYLYYIGCVCECWFGGVLMVSYCSPSSDSSCSRGGKSTGKHRQGSSPLHPPCTISLFFLWQQKLHIHREKLVLMVERGGPLSACTLQGMQLYNNCSAKYHSSLYICHGGSRYFPLFILAGYSTFCHSPNSTSWKLSMIEYFPFLFLPGNPAPIFLY